MWKLPTSLNNNFFGNRQTPTAQKTIPLDESNLNVMERNMPRSSEYFNVNTGNRVFGAMSNNPNYAKREVINYTPEQKREKVQQLWNNSPLQQTIDPATGQIVAKREVDNPYQIDNIGNKLSYSWILPKGSTIGSNFTTTNAPQTDAQRGSMYRYGGNYVNSSTRLSPNSFMNSSFKLPTSSRTGRLLPGGITDYSSGRYYNNNRSVMANPVYGSFRGNSLNKLNLPNNGGFSSNLGAYQENKNRGFYRDYLNQTDPAMAMPYEQYLQANKYNPRYKRGY
jgi:hypothetical protein